MTTFEFLLFAMAVWRISYALVWEDGPYNLMEVIRRRAPYPLGRIGRPSRTDITPRQGMLSCVYCTSFSVAILVYLFWLWQPEIAGHAILILAGWGLASFLEDGLDLINSHEDDDG